MTRAFGHILGGALLAATLTLPAMAQSGAPIRQGTTTGELTETVDVLRQANGDLQIRLDRMEADNARLTGRLEELDFLFSETNNELNRLQTENTEIGRRLRETEDTIAALTERLETLERTRTTSYRSLQTPGVERPDPSNRVVTRTVTRDGTTREEPVRAQPSGTTTSRTASETAIGDTTTATGAVSRDSATGTLGQLSASNLPGEAGPLFQEAKRRLLRFQYAEAEIAFEAFLEDFGDAPEAAEARYWLGEVLYQQGAYAESGLAFTEMLREYPDDARAPEALIKLARSLRSVGDTEKACAALKTLSARYPDANSNTLRSLADAERVRAGCTD